MDPSPSPGACARLADMRSLLELSCDWHWSLDEQWRLVEMHGRHLDAGPHTLLALLGLAPWSWPGVQAGEPGSLRLRATLQKRQAFIDHEVGLRDHRGQRRYFLLCGEPQFDGDGRFAGYAGITRDLTHRRRAEALVRLEHAVTRRIAEAHSSHKILEAVMQVICESEQWESGGFFRAEDAQGTARLVAGWAGPGRSEAATAYYRGTAGQLVPPGGLISRVITERRPLWVDALTASQTTWAERLRHTGEQSTFLFPVLADGQVLGVFAFASREAREPDEPLLQSLEVVGEQVGQYLQRRHAERRLRHLATHDSLTGLPNRLLLQERAEHELQRACADGHGFALLLIDLDRFKQINDSFGHASGDEVLRAVAQRLMQTLGASGTVVRMGGDEFAVLLPQVDRAEAALDAARQICETMGDKIIAGGTVLHVTPSIGIALHPEHGADLSTLLRHADAAMYDAKGRGCNGASLYRPDMSTHTRDQFELLAGLREALARDELVLHYQPLVDARSGEVRALEALVRWQHPGRGLVPPADFIPLAEDTGLIVPIGAWVLRQACADLAALRAKGRPGLRVAVNLSARQFIADGLEDTVAEALRASGLPGDALELEITESVLVVSLERTQASLQRLRALGVRVAIDDFGTGYSSLSYLASFPVQTLKVDRSFVRQIDAGEGTALLAGGIVALAHSLGLDVVAEGIETPAQCAYLLDARCELLQGFLFSKPVPLHALDAAMARCETMPLPRAQARIELWGATRAA
jgi:diguanylate cyclase (GGDEF)-like protein